MDPNLTHINAWAGFNTAYTDLSSANEDVPDIDTSDLQPLFGPQDDPMLPCLSPTATEHGWKSLFSDCASSALEAAANDQTCADAEKPQVGSETMNIAAFPEALRVANSTVNIHLQSHQEADSLTRQRLERMEAGLHGSQQTLSRLDTSLSVMQTEGLRMRVAQAQILETLEKIKKGLDRFFTHVAFDVALAFSLFHKLEYYRTLRPFKHSSHDAIALAPDGFRFLFPVYRNRPILFINMLDKTLPPLPLGGSTQPIKTLAKHIVKNRSAHNSPSRCTDPQPSQATIENLRRQVASLQQENVELRRRIVQADGFLAELANTIKATCVAYQIEISQCRPSPPVVSGSEEIRVYSEFDFED